MKCNKARTVYNPYLKLPSYGENRTKLLYDESNLELTIFYDNENDENDFEEKSIEINFSGVCFFAFSGFPGVKVTNIEYDTYSDINSLVEFEYSEVKLKWEKHFDNLFTYRHFKIFFTSSNESLEVICRDLKVIEN